MTRSALKNGSTREDHNYVQHVIGHHMTAYLLWPPHNHHTQTHTEQFYGKAMASFLQAHGHHGASVIFHLVCEACCVCSWWSRPQFTEVCGKEWILGRILGRFWTFFDKIICRWVRVYLMAALFALLPMGKKPCWNPNTNSDTNLDPNLNPKTPDSNPPKI